MTVRAEPGVARGRYFLAARITDRLGQFIKDAAPVTVGERAAPDADLPVEELLPLIEADQNAAETEVIIELLTPQVSCADSRRA